MRTVHFRSLSIAAVVVLTFAGSVAAQEKPSGLLNSLEVQQLVEAGRAGRQRAPRCALHGSRGSLRRRSQAPHRRWRRALSATQVATLGTGMSAHCKQLADLNTKSATELRELAAYHQKLASGVTATPPAEGARFEGGAGAPAPTETGTQRDRGQGELARRTPRSRGVPPDAGEAVHGGRH